MFWPAIAGSGSTDNVNIQDMADAFERGHWHDVYQENPWAYPSACHSRFIPGLPLQVGCGLKPRAHRGIQSSREGDGSSAGLRALVRAVWAACVSTTSLWNMWVVTVSDVTAQTNKQSTETIRWHSIPGRNLDNHPQQGFSHFTEYDRMESELLCLAVMKADVSFHRGKNPDLRLVSAGC